MHSSPMVEFFFIFKHSKRFHCIAELLGVVVVYFSWGREANRRGDAIVFLRLLPTRHGAAINVVQQIKKQILHHHLAHFFKVSSSVRTRHEPFPNALTRL